MARSRLSTVWVALALTAVACNQRTVQTPKGTVTVKLPPARPAPPAPAFSFGTQGKVGVRKRSLD
jgi:hypothetical protein